MSKAKGRRTVTKAIAFFHDKGMIVDEVELGGRFRKSKDLFAGLCTKCWKLDCSCNEPRFDGFDIIAMDGSNVWLVQIKTNKPPTQKPYIRFATGLQHENPVDGAVDPRCCLLRESQ